jgi:hypothetical protein
MRCDIGSLKNMINDVGNNPTLAWPMLKLQAQPMSRLQAF